MTTVTLRAQYSTWIQQDHPTANWFRKTGYMSLYGKSGRANMGIVWFANPIPRTGGNVLRATLTVKTRRINGSGASQMTAQLCDAWSAHFGSVNWNTRPAGKLAQASLSKSNPLPENQTWQFDVTAQMQAIASGEPFYGFVLTTSSQHQILVQGNMSAALDPSLSVEWIENPMPPEDLAPSTGQAVGTGSPVLTWRYRDFVGGDVLAACQVRTGTSETMVSSAPSWDSGEVATTVPQLDLSAVSGWNAPAADTLVWWQVRCRDSSGLWSGWSDPVSWQWHPRLSVSLVQPEPEPVDVAGPELLTNGGFDDWLTGWATTGTLEQISSGPMPPHAAIRGAGSLSQSVVLDPGAGTTVTVTHQNDPGVGSTVTVSPDVGNPVTAVMPDSGNDWVTTTVNLPAGASSATVTIAGTKLSTRVDNVTARQIVEGLPTFSDPTPVIQWATSGDMAQARWLAAVQTLSGSRWVTVASSGVVVSSETSWTPDVGLATAGRVRIIVQAWDARAREATPGMATYGSVSGEFSFQPSATVEAVGNLTVTDMAPMPQAVLRFTRSEVPDRIDVYRDNVLLSRHEGLDFSGGGDDYEVTDAACPNGTHTWKVWAIVNGIASKSSAVTATMEHPGSWLIDPDTQERVWIQGEKSHDMTMPETVAEFSPIGARSRVRITSSQYGYEGTLSGVLAPQPYLPDTETPRLWRERLMAWKADPGHDLVMLIEDLDFHVAITEVTCASTHPWVGERFDVSLKFHQLDRFIFGADSILEARA